MWIDTHGVIHSVALPVPEDLMSLVFKTSLDSLLCTERAAVSLVLEQAEERILGQDFTTPADPAREHVFAGMSPPASLLDGPLTTPEAVATAISNTPWRWRLDVVIALQDYIE